MNSEIIGGIGIGALLLLMVLGLPIWLCMSVVGFAGYFLVSGGWTLHQALVMVAECTRGTLFSYTFSILPVFLLMGEFANISGLMTDTYRSVNVWLSKVPGGLAIASVFGSAGFSLLSGSSTATCAIMGRTALPQLVNLKYNNGLAAGALVAGGTLGNLIPPGMLLVIYAMIAQVSIGKLYIACYIPGFLLAFMYTAQIFIQCKLNPSFGPPARSSTWKEKLLALKGLVMVIIVFGITLGGIQSGVFTANEAASITTVIVFIFALVRKTVNGQNLLEAFKNTLITSGMAMAILVGTQIFNVFMAMSGLPQELAGWIIGLHLSQLGVIIIIMLLLFILGIPMSPLVLILLVVPILLPVLNAYSIDLVWFGVLTIVTCEMAGITPPEGINLFVIASMGKPYGITLGDVFRGTMPYIATCTVFLILLIAFPQIATWLVALMK